MNYFTVSKRCVSSARELNKSSGILLIVPKKTGRSLSDEIKLSIYSIYNSDECSRTCLGKKEQLSVKIGGKREACQEMPSIAQFERTSYRIYGALRDLVLSVQF